MTRDEARRAQQRLGVAADGIVGRGTLTALFMRMGAGATVAGGLALGANVHLRTYGILDTPLRLAHFVGQCAHETGGFRWLREIWGPTRAQAGYEGRRNLGNVVAGDGKRFMGRGIMQLTGRANYEAASIALGLPLTDMPELAELPAIGVLTACWFWDANGLNRLADADDVTGLTRKINGGTNGLADRRARLTTAKEILL